MERKIRKVKSASPPPKPTRVAAYARVSSAKDAMLHSLSAQVSYYSDLIQKHGGWRYMGVYADEGITGTKESRPEFQRLIADCLGGKVDMVIAKSISRFARNTVTLLETARKLKEVGVDVYFEEQNIHTISGEGELMLTLLASFAQEESRSVSENQKWRVRRNFEDGKPWNCTMLGYRQKDGVLTVAPEEAEVVRRIFADYLGGKGAEAITKELNADSVPTRNGGKWCKGGVLRVLRNEAYTGGLLLQKTYRENYLTKRTLVNSGELPMYRVEDCHEAIIDKDTFNAAQAEMERRAAKHTHVGVSQKTYPFTGLLVCGNCGKHYRRKVTATRPVWICPTFNSLGKAACPSKQIPEETLAVVAADALGLDALDEQALRGEITAIRVMEGNTLVFVFRDGHEAVKRWQDRSRSESWTEDMKRRASEKAKERYGECRQQEM